MSSILQLADRRGSSQEQNPVAQNVANANTPGYKTSDLTPFEASLEMASLQLTTTSPMHISIPQSEFQIAPEETTKEKRRYFRSRQ